MAHAIWSGAINFGLVTIPVKLQTAIRTNDLRFNFLHKTDEGRIQNVRRCSIDGEEVAYTDLVRGYEYEKGRYVILTDEDFDRVNPEATQSVDIVQFVDLSEINPMYFDKPYYLEPEKRGRHAYALLREALKDTGKVGIAKVVIRSREHIAALKPNGDALVLELMHFADEIVDQSSLELPATEKPAENEMKVARMLIDTMTEAFEAEKFSDTYREQVLAMIEARAAGKETPKGSAPAKPKDNVVNLMDVLQKSLERSKNARDDASPKRDVASKNGERAKSTGRTAQAGHAARAQEDEKPKKTAKRKSRLRKHGDVVPASFEPARFAFTLAIALATLDGRVLDTTTGQPLVHVRVESGKARATTDTRGRFILHGIHPGNVTLTLESNDVPTQHVTVHVGTGATHRDVRACSTTLDYNCGSPTPSAPDASSGAG